jgi:hypothetical protein
MPKSAAISIRLHRQKGSEHKCCTTTHTVLYYWCNFVPPPPTPWLPGLVTSLPAPFALLQLAACRVHPTLRLTENEFYVLGTILSHSHGRVARIEAVKGAYEFLVENLRKATQLRWYISELFGREPYPRSHQLYDLKFSRRWLWRMGSSGILRRVALVRTDFSEELSAYITRVTRIGEIGTTLSVISQSASVVSYV